MPRGLSEAVISALNQSYISGIFYLVTIVLPNGTTLYLGERGVLYGGHTYLPVIKGISNLPYVLSGNDQVELTLLNVDGYFTDLDLETSFLAARVQIYEYLPALSTPVAYLKWQGWADDLTDITTETARLVAYTGLTNLKTEVPKREISLTCPWFFGNTRDPISATDFEGSECPYQKYSTIGFTSTLLSAINDYDNPVIFSTSGLPGSLSFALDDDLLIDDEIFRVLTKEGDILTCTRGIYNTTVVEHAINADIKFYDCHYDVSACKRRGMYGNNSADTYHNYFGGFPLLSVVFPGLKKNIFAKPSKAGTFSGNDSLYGSALPLFYGRSLTLDAQIPIASVIGTAGYEEVWTAIVILVGEGLLATNAYNDDQTIPQNAYALSYDGLERIFVNGKRRHDARPTGLECSNGWFCASNPNIGNIPLFATDKLGFQGSAWICLQMKAENNDDAADGVIDGLSAEVEIRYGRCVRVYSSPTSYTFKATQDPADVLLDMETAKRGGCGLDYDQFNITSFIDARLHNQETVKSVVDGTDKPRWTFNGAISGKKPAADQERMVCLSMYCLLPFLDINGKFKLKPLKSETTSGVPVFSSFSSYTAYRNILSNDKGVSSLKKSRKALLDIPNEIKINFVESSPYTSTTRIKYADVKEYTKSQVVLIDREAQRRVGRVTGLDSRRVVSKSYDFPGISSVDEAARLGTLILRAGEFAEGGAQNNLTIEFETFYRGSSDVELGDIIQVEDALLDPVAEAYFRIIHIEDQLMDTQESGILFKRVIRATLHLNSMYDDTAYTCTDLTRLPMITTHKSEPPAVSNFDITETGVVDRYGTNKALLNITFTAPGEHTGAVNGNHSISDTTIVIMDLDDETFSGFVGDLVYFTGHTTVYRLTEDVDFSDGAATITLDLGIEASLTSGIEMKIVSMLERGSFRSVVLMRSSTDGNGDPVGDWHFVTEIVKSGTQIFYDITQHLECFCAVSKSVTGLVPDVNTKAADNEYKFPRIFLVPDGSEDSGVPSGASGLLIRTTVHDTSIPKNNMVFRFNRDTANFESIRDVYISLTATLPGYGPYAAQKTAYPANVVASGVDLAVLAGVNVVNVGSDPGSVVGKFIVIHGVGGDSYLDWQSINTQNGAILTLQSPFSHTGAFSWEIIEPWIGSGDNAFDYIFKVPNDLHGKNLYDTLWSTIPVSLIEGVFYAVAYSKNIFGAPPNILASPLTTIGVDWEDTYEGLENFEEVFSATLLERWNILAVYGAFTYNSGATATKGAQIRTIPYYEYVSTNKYDIHIQARRTYTDGDPTTQIFAFLLDCFDAEQNYLGTITCGPTVIGLLWDLNTWYDLHYYVQGEGSGGDGSSGTPYQLPVGTAYLSIVAVFNSLDAGETAHVMDISFIETSIV
jgi:hypothetical protein